MICKFLRLSVGLLPLCFLSAQQPDSPRGFRQPSLEVVRHTSEMQQRMREHANAINDLAGRIQSLDDARRLVNLVAAEFSSELPLKWATRGIRERIARAEYESAVDPGALIPEQRVADAWDDYLQKIGAPQDSMVTAAEIHTLRDSYYVSAQVAWAYGNQNLWTVSNIYAVGPDGKVADGCRALEVLNILWQLANQPDLLTGTRELMKEGKRMSDIYKAPSKPPAPGTVHGYVTARISPPNPIWICARRYTQDHGPTAFNHAVESLLSDLFRS